MAEVNFQTKQVEYLKGRVEKQDEMLQEISSQIRQRNFDYKNTIKKHIPRCHWLYYAYY